MSNIFRRRGTSCFSRWACLLPGPATAGQDSTFHRDHPAKGVFAWCWANRAAEDASLLDLLCFASVLWTYHGPYDFVILLIPLVRRVIPLLTTGAASFRGWPGPLVALVTFACISLAASSVVYGDESHLASRIVRHGARLLLWLWFAGLALQATWAARPPKTAPNRPKARETSLGSYNSKAVRRGRRLGVAPTGFDV